jgi:hypothetical protein
MEDGGKIVKKMIFDFDKQQSRMTNLCPLS